MNDYKEMSMLYEAFAKSPHVGHARATNRAYPPGQSDNMHHSYGPHMPFKDPGGSGGRAYDAALAGTQGIAHVISDEETPVEPKEIMNLDVIDKIDSLIKDAERFEDTKTILALDELKRYINKL